MKARISRYSCCRRIASTPQLRERFDDVLPEPGIHAARLFCTAPELSAPIGADAAARPAADALVLIEGSDAAATRRVAATLAGHDDVRTFELLWRAAAPLHVTHGDVETAPAARMFGLIAHARRTAGAMHTRASARRLIPFTITTCPTP